jgi:hypothetical protein
MRTCVYEAHYSVYAIEGHVYSRGCVRAREKKKKLVGFWQDTQQREDTFLEYIFNKLHEHELDPREGQRHT